jgi:hypothetical protein
LGALAGDKNVAYIMNQIAIKTTDSQCVMFRNWDRGGRRNGSTPLPHDSRDRRRHWTGCRFQGRADKGTGGRQILNRDQGGGDEIDEGTGDPHDDAGGDLIAESCRAEEARDDLISGVKGVLGKGKDGGQNGVENVRGQEIERNAPERPI